MKHCIYIPGPNELHAMPDKETAEKCAAIHNKAIERFIEKARSDSSMVWLKPEMIKAEVLEWPYSNYEHAMDLKDFDQKEWGLE